jgi:hypothetical protein
MSSVTTSPGILHNIFTPLPEAPENRAKDHLDHIAHYADSTEGAWDIFRVIDCTLSYVKLLPSLSANWLEVVGKVKDVASSVGIGLSIPKIISSCNTLRRSFTNLVTVQDLPYSDPLRPRKIALAAKKSFIDSVDLTWALTQAALFIDSAKIFIFKTQHLRFFEGINNVASAISDGAELITEYFKLKHYHSPEAQPRNPAEANKLEERKRLSWMTVAKDAASIGASAIVLVGIAFGVASQSIAVISGAVLALSTVWLTLKLATYFYNKIVVEKPISPANRFIALQG